MTFILIMIVMIACAGFCDSIAKSKGHSRFAWTMAGLFFGPLAVLAAAGLGTKPVEVKRELTVEEAREQGKKQIMQLAVMIFAAAMGIIFFVKQLSH